MTNKHESTSASAPVYAIQRAVYRKARSSWSAASHCLRWILIFFCTISFTTAIRDIDSLSRDVELYSTSENSYENAKYIPLYPAYPRELQNGINLETEEKRDAPEDTLKFVTLEGILNGYLDVYEPSHGMDGATSFMEIYAHSYQSTEQEQENESEGIQRGTRASQSGGKPGRSSFSTKPIDNLSSSTKKPFKPRKKYNFRNVSIDVADMHMDLRDRNGIVVGRFTLTDEDSYTLALLSTINQRNYTKCNVKWVPESKGKKASDGYIHFECNSKVPAKGYTGEIPIAIEITGLSKNKLEKIYLNTDGYNFRREFEDLDSIKHAILIAVGIDLDHQIKITKVNGRRLKNDAAVYKAIMEEVDTGSKLIRLTVEPMIRLAANVQEPYSASSEQYNHYVGNLSVDDYVKTLRDRKKLAKIAKDNLGEDAEGFTLVGINDLHEGSKGFNAKKPTDMPIEMDEKWTFMPDVTVRFHYLDSFVTRKSFPVHTLLSSVVAAGRDIMKKTRGGNAKVYRVYAYSLPGCPLEEPDIYELMKKTKGITISKLPFSEACFNRRTHIIDFFYLNNKPANYIFDVELTNPDGTSTSTKRITVKYVDDTDLSVLKDAIVKAFERDGHLITPEDLTFINVVAADGHDVTDKTKILKLSEIPKEQMMGHPSQIKVKVHPHIIGYFTEPSGKHDTFDIDLDSTKPSTADIKNAFEDELRRRNLLNPNEHLHSNLKFHPVDNKHKIKMNMFLYPDDGGVFPAGTKLRDMAAEADSRYEIPISFRNDDGKLHKFKVYVPYGASDQQIEDIIADEIEKQKYGSRPHEMVIRIKGHDDDGLGDIWNGSFGDNTELEAEPARLVDIDGMVDDIPTKFTLKIHPHEGRDELERAIRRSLMREPELERHFKENPNHIKDISTIIIGDNGNPYSDDDFTEHDLYNNHKRVRIGISDHPFTITWKNPESGKETTFCFSRSQDGTCRGAPMHILARLTFHKLAELLKNTLRRENKALYEEMMSIPRKNKHMTSSLKLDGISLVNGQHLINYDIQLSDPVLMLEHIYGVNISHLSSIIFTLMSHEEQQQMHERGGKKNTFRIMLSKRSGEPESHAVVGDDFGPAELRNLINKYFRGVDDLSNIEDMTINGDTYDGQPLSYFYNRMPDKSTPIKISFKVANDDKPARGPSLSNVRIQPKYHETLRSYFDRAMEEPRDFGLSPLHSYMVSCIDEKGEHVHIDNILDQPLSALGICKDIEVQTRKQGRSNDPNHVYAMDPDDKMELRKTITLDEKKDNTSNLNRQLRNFLMDIPEDELSHVTVLIDDKPVKCSLSSLREAYRIRNLTLDTLLSLCNMDSRKTEPSVIKLNFQMDSPDAESKSKSKRKTEFNPEDGPMCYFTLQKGQHDIGIGSAVPITLGTLKSPLKDFYSKIASMFGHSAMHIGGMRMSVVRNGETAMCNTAGQLNTLSDFKKVPMHNILKMCNIPVVVPEDNRFYHFRISIPFGEDMSYTANVRMGGNVPVEMIFKDDDEFSTIHYNEDLHLPIYDFLIDQPDVDLDNLDHYTLKIRGQNPGSDTVNRSFRLDHLPSEMSLASIFPHTPMNNIVFEIDDNSDPYNSAGGWQTGMSYPVNDYRNNFDAIKQQMIINLKGMHGNGLSNLNGYTVVVRINGKKHRCHIKSLAELDTMTFEEFSKSCVNIDHIQNNPSMSFNVAYESGRGEPEINLSCLSRDYDTLKTPGLSPHDNIPQKLIDELKKKYGGNDLKNVQWGVTINGMQGNCHFDDISSSMSLSEILDICGVDDPLGKRFDITFHDLSVDYNDADAERKGNGNGKPQAADGVNVKIKLNAENDENYVPLFSSQPNHMHSSAGFSDVHPNIFVNMPQDYHGPNINVDGHKSMNDYIREIIIDEDQSASGVPINIRVNNNGHDYDFNTIPMDDLNYPSEYLNGNVSVNVRADESGSLPGTIRTFHLPQSDKPLSSYFKILRTRIPNIGDKKIILVGKNTMLEEDHIPIHLLNTPMKDLKTAGFVISLVNNPEDFQPAGAVHVDILSKDGFSSSATISDLQDPLTNVFKKIAGDSVDVASLAGAKFKVIIDGIEKVCQLPSLSKVLTSVSMQDILSNCGINDFNHNHNFTLYFDSLLGGESGGHRNPFKVEVDLDDKVDSTKNVDYSTGIDFSDSVFDFLKSKPNSHIFFDMEGKGFREFVEVDTEKFRKLLKLHPSVVDLLLRMGVPQEHLGGVDCLKIILSTLSQVLQGHQQYSVNNAAETANFSMEDPLGKYQSILEIAKVLKEYSDQNVTVTVQLTSGNTKNFTIPNLEFLHALNGGLSFKDVALWGLSKDEADQIININFNTAPLGGVKEEIPEPVQTEVSGTPETTASSERPQKNAEQAETQDKTEQLEQPTREAEPTHDAEPMEDKLKNEAINDEQGSSSIKPKRKPPPRPPSPKMESPKAAHNAGTITPSTMLNDVSVISKAMQEHDRNVKFVVSTRGGDNFEIIVKGSMLKNTSKHGPRIIDLLSYFMPSDVVDTISAISVQLVTNTKKFFVPLSAHEPFVMPVMASDHPTDCQIQEFKNPWNPSESSYRRMTIEKAIADYREHYKINKHLMVKGAYLLRKEAGNNISAEILFDENHKVDSSILNRKIGSDIDNGSTLFIRFMSSGELAI